MEQRIYTKATDRLRELHKNYGGAKSGNPITAVYFDNCDHKNDTGNFAACVPDEFYYESFQFKEVSEQEFIDFMELEPKATQGQPHYDNSNGSLYLIAKQRGWNAYQFDIIKRIDRALKKGQFNEDLEKTKFLIDLWLKEEENESR